MKQNTILLENLIFTQVTESLKLILRKHFAVVFSRYALIFKVIRAYYTFFRYCAAYHENKVIPSIRLYSVGRSVLQIFTF